MISYRDGLPIDDDDSYDRSADQVPIDIRLDEKMRDVEESERIRIAFSNKECEFEFEKRSMKKTPVT